MKQHIIPTLGVALAALPVMADQVITGTITDAHSHEGLSGVYVQAFTDASRSTMTDSLGRFELTVPDFCASLRIRRAGYQTQQLAIAGRTQGVSTSLWPDAFTGRVGVAETSIQSLSAEVSDLTSDVSVDTQIASHLAGQLRSISRGGIPGQGAFMLINGINSLSSNAQPLVVVDGIIQDMQYGQSNLHSGAYNNLLASLSVQDIASVEVLKNGTAIYGAKGSNGVILITTRRGRSLDTHIDFSAATTFGETPKLPQVMNASQYRTYVSEMLGTTGTKLNEFKFLREDPNYYYYNIYHNETDWTDQTYQNSQVQSYNLNVQGGDDVAVYNLSIGYTGADAALQENDFSRFNMRINSDVVLSDHVKVRLDASYSDVSRDLRDDGVPASLDGGIISAPGFLSLIKSPFLSPYAYDTQGNLSSFLSGADDYLKEVIGTEASLANPASILYYGEAPNKNKLDNRLITLGITPIVTLPHHLKLTEAFNFTMFNTEERYYLPVTGVPSYRVKGLGYVSNINASTSSRQYLATNDLRLDWLYRHEGHKLDLTGGFRFNMSSYQGNGMLGYNSGNDKMPNMSSSLSYRQTDGDSQQITTLTYYAAGDYNYAGRFYANVGLAAEASSRFGADADALKFCGVPWAILPSVSGSWVLSNEKWFHVPAIDYMRLNLGWDLTANDGIDLNASKTWFKSVTLFQQVCGTVAGNIGNTNLKWETTNRISGGIDMNLFNNRLSLSLQGFQSWTSDLLTRQALPFVIGISENWCNGGSLKNTGFTLDAQAKVLNTRNLHWQLGLSMGMYRNEVTELNGGNFLTEAYGATILTEVGGPISQFYGYETDGVFATTAEAQESGLYITDETGKRTYFQAGDMRFVDRDGNHEINEKDRTVIGNPNPDIYGNISSRLQYRGLTFDAVFGYSLGNDVYNYQRSVLESGSRFYNQTTALCARWSTEGQQTNIPRLAYEDPMGNARFSDRWIEDGSYLRLRNVTLSYKWDFDYRFLQGITLWGAANNLFTLTPYLGTDPETSASNSALLQGIDSGLLPVTRSYSVGIKINL